MGSVNTWHFKLSVSNHWPCIYTWNSFCGLIISLLQMRYPGSDHVITPGLNVVFTLASQVINALITKQHHFMTWPCWHTFRDALVCKYMLHVCSGEGCSHEGTRGGVVLLGSAKCTSSAFTTASLLSWQTFAQIHVCEQVQKVLRRKTESTV